MKIFNKFFVSVVSVLTMFFIDIRSFAVPILYIKEDEVLIFNEFVDKNGNNYQLTFSILKDKKGDLTKFVQLRDFNTIKLNSGTIDLVIPKSVTYKVTNNYINKYHNNFSKHFLNELISEGNTYEVVEIGFCAFYKKHEIKTVRIPNSIEKIHQRAFQDCRGLQELNFEPGSNISKIDCWTFFRCERLRSVEIPSGVFVIGCQAFGFCIDLVNVLINPEIEVIGSCAFEGCLIETINIPESTLVIGLGAFMNCKNLVNINGTGPNLQEISRNAFEGCINLSIPIFMRV